MVWLGRVLERVEEGFSEKVIAQVLIEDLLCIQKEDEVLF